MNHRNQNVPESRLRVRKTATVEIEGETRVEDAGASDARLSDLTSRCIRCGFCLPACPTFTLTGAETESPRGRIALAKAAMDGEIRWAADVGPHLDACLGCRACETACPSGVRYGEIFEIAKGRIAAQRTTLPVRALLAILTRPRLFHATLWWAWRTPIGRILAASTRLAIPQPPRSWNLPPLDPATLPPVRGRVALIEGCVMGVLYPHVHRATRRLLRRLGWETTTVSGCCGALHLHCGYRASTARLARRLARRVPDEGWIVVNSAGCGSVMKEYGEHLDAGLRGCAQRVRDLSEVLVAEGMLELLSRAPGLPIRATYLDPCHLAHAQGIRKEPRALLEAVPGLELVPVPESDTCCGSAGVYNVTQPRVARELLDRKMRNVERTGASVLVTANPGCQAWLEYGARVMRSQGSGFIAVRHLAEVLESAFHPPSEAPPRTTGPSDT